MGSPSTYAISLSGIYTTNSMEATRYVAEHSRANIMVVEDEEQYAKVWVLPHVPKLQIRF